MRLRRPTDKDTYMDSILTIRVTDITVQKVADLAARRYYLRVTEFELSTRQPATYVRSAEHDRSNTHPCSTDTSVHSGDGWRSVKGP